MRWAAGATSGPDVARCRGPSVSDLVLKEDDVGAVGAGWEGDGAAARPPEGGEGHVNVIEGVADQAAPAVGIFQKLIVVAAGEARPTGFDDAVAAFRLA